MEGNSFSCFASGVETKVLFIICLHVPTQHLGVFKNSLKRVRVFQIELEFGSVGF